ncbi:MAG TPA: BlaI/MecI/CopY family transcriptional regulator [Vicinamibacterales bacterium]|nr:BlaI/MecI/CopY family transcriptional regulator [Vicinamibacterales bacterium]
MSSSGNYRKLDTFYSCSSLPVVARRPDHPVLSEAEWKLMNAVWDGTGAVSAREVWEALRAETGWAYTTVKTQLDRLVQKGVLSVTIDHHASQYRPELRRQRAVAAAARDLARRAFGGRMAPLVHHLIRAERLSPRDRAELRRMLDDDAEGKVRE